MKHATSNKTRSLLIRLAAGALGAAVMTAGAAWAGGPPDVCAGVEHVACDGPYTVYDFFGNPAISGLWAIIGRRADSTGYYNYAGAVYFYELVEGEWQKHSKLTANYPGYGYYLGESVAIDCNRAVASAPGWSSNRGRLHVFEREVDSQGGSTWSEVATLYAQNGNSGDYLGGNLLARHNIAISDGLIAAGAHSAGGLFIGTPSTDVGYVAVFRNTSSGWVEDAILHWRSFTSDPAVQGWFGASVAIEGTRLVIGEPRRDDGRVYVARLVNGQWTLEQIIEPPQGSSGDEFGYSVALEGNRLAIGARGFGEAFIYENDGSGWSHTGTLVSNAAGNHVLFGNSIALSGPMVLVGDREYEPQGTTAGAAFLFQLRPNGDWEHVLTLDAGGPTQLRFGDSVALRGSEAIVSSLRNITQGVSNVGAIYTFTRLPLCDSYDPACGN